MDCKLMVFYIHIYTYAELVIYPYILLIIPHS